ncbi:MAG: class I SAM-dependent methyltransferase [Chloroflexi bacterium]|nr:class I SAM-dependent methyltransferase [Chloroflexota bacterium]
MTQESQTPWYVRFFKGDYLRVYGHTLQPNRTDLETQFAIHALDLQPHHNVLDLCCGQGRHSIALAKTGLSVTGVDLSEEMLAIARSTADEAGAILTLHQADMRHLPDDLKNRFDAVINMFSSFGYLESEEDDQQVLHQIAKALKPGGKLLMDLLNREWVIINNQEFDWHQHEDGRVVLERRQLDLKNSSNTVTYTEILPDGTRREMSDLQLRLYTLTELTKMLTKAGLTLQNVYGGFQAEPYNVNTRRMIVVASNPGLGGVCA